MYVSVNWQGSLATSGCLLGNYVTENKDVSFVFSVTLTEGT